MFGENNSNNDNNNIKSPKNPIMGLIQKYKERKLTTGHVRQLNNIVICLMILVAIISIVWTMSMHVLAGDFYDGFIGAKLAFRERDFTQMTNTEKDLFYHDLGRIINQTYTEAALDNNIRADALIMPKETTDEEITTVKPKVRKIAHVFQISNSKVPDKPAINTDDDDDEGDDDTSNTTPKVPKIIFNMEKDRRFLAQMSIDIHQSRWHQNFAVRFIYGFPYFSEIVAIIWTTMCFIFQSGVKKHWGLPKPWRIVVPSIIMFTIMTVTNLSYLILANGFVKTFCKELRENLSDPDAISCGDAMSVLRPIIRQHEFSLQNYLKLFKYSYTLALVLWILALLIMVLRFILAIDFQMVDIETNYDREMREGKFSDRDFVEVLLSSPQHQRKPKNELTVLKKDRPRSEDDFQSAKSHVSEVATPLLDPNAAVVASTSSNLLESVNERRT